jgi:cholesterol transport system auxiliary component
MTNRFQKSPPAQHRFATRFAIRFATRFAAAGLASAALLLAGCAAPQRESAGLYDLGLLPGERAVAATGSAAGTAAAGMPKSLPALSVAEPTVPTWLDRQTMMYRLAYANDLQPHAYAGSRWTSPPVQLFTQRLKARIGQGGGVVVPASDGALNALTLHIEADDFSQIFNGPAESFGNISVRASILRDRLLIGQKTFSARMPAPTPDAEGGVRALSQASDTVIDDMTRWLATLPSQK